ncbi:HSP20-like chaperones superfamily protein [Striga asiatica]|uniref:HSP20-like chaperones superfamily protein n=1 Tax=Striga asiatica TaxID=4170 RepID=A0A5A7PVV2_STRAF|nr:HSP20-like chaperones superfamily protein [Striga asiatica]
MDSLDTEKVKKIIWKKRKTELDTKADSANSSVTCKERDEKRQCCDSTQVSSILMHSNLAQPFVLPVLPTQKVDKCCSNISTVFTGTACRGSGPPVGTVDIGIGKFSYYFCIALPGVKHGPGEFYCHVQSDGKVRVEGVTSTGGKIVEKYSRVFEMKIQQQCPTGPFTLFFTLPGPVDPNKFFPTFRSDAYGDMLLSA